MTSEYYKLRRRKIADGMALAGFIIGIIVPAYAAGKLLVEGFESGLETEGLKYFVLNLLVNGLIGGAIGLAVGYAVGLVWQHVHMRLRSSDTTQGSAAFTDSGFPLSRASRSDAAPADGVAALSDSGPPADIVFTDGNVTAADFTALLTGPQPHSLDEELLAEALGRTTNIAAWSGGRLVGVVRVLTDGYLFATIPHLFVAPEFRKRGIGRELMQRALNAAPSGVVLFSSPPEASGFFERLGCQRAPTGYVMRHRVAARVQMR